MAQQQQTYTYAPLSNNPAGIAPQGYALYADPRPVYPQQQEQSAQSYQLPPEYRYTTQPVYQNPTTTTSSTPISYANQPIQYSQKTNIQQSNTQPYRVSFNSSPVNTQPVRPISYEPTASYNVAPVLINPNLLKQAPLQANQAALQSKQKEYNIDVQELQTVRQTDFHNDGWCSCFKPVTFDTNKKGWC